MDYYISDATMYTSVHVCILLLVVAEIIAFKVAWRDSTSDVTGNNKKRSKKKPFYCLLTDD